MEIHANRSTCIGAGQCVFTDPGTFDQDDNGLVVVVRSEPASSDEIARAREAVDLCPSRSLAIVETATA